MKLPQNVMAESARTIGTKKFSSMSPKRQHELIAALAWDALLKNEYPSFKKRYRELLSWVELDRYSPPSWLEEKEALNEYISFHNRFTPTPVVVKNETDSEIVERKPISWEPHFTVEVVLDQVRSPFNVGSILRLIDNFGLSGLVHSTPELSLSHPQLVKSARGCEKWIPVRYEDDLYTYLKTSTDTVIAIEKDDDAIELKDWNPPRSCKLVLGNETYGIASAIRSVCHEKICIPMFGFKHSMNVNTAFSVVANRISEMGQ